jgi:hypothetical protein
LIKYKNNNEIYNLNNKFKNNKQIIIDSLFYINFLFDNSDNTNISKKFVLNEYYNIMSVIHNKYNTIIKESYQLYKKFINCEFISNEDKNNLKLYYNSLIN